MMSFDKIMVQKDKEKELLLKDLCSRLPYKVKVQIKNVSKICTLEEIDCSDDEMSVAVKHENGELSGYDFDLAKPYLLPLSSMTEEQWINAPRVNLTDFTFESLKCGCFTLASYTCENNLHDLLEFINWLYKNHFDVNDLIPLGLAIDATTLNLY